MADNEEIEIPVLLLNPKAPDGTMFGVGRFSSLFGRLFGAIRSHPWVLAAIAVTGTLRKTIVAWADHQKAVNSLNQTLIQQGIFSRELSDSYQEMALAIQEQTQFSDEEVIAAQASMQAYLRGQVISKELMRAVVDFAAAKGMDLAKAAELVGKSIGTGTNALMRHGIAIDEALGPGARTEAVIAAMNGKWGGQAEAMVQGLGAIRQMGNALQGVLEVIGKSLEPFVVMVAQAAARLFAGLSQSAAFAEGLGKALDGIEIGAVAIRHAIAAAFEIIPTLIRSRLTAATQAMQFRMQRAQDIRDAGDAQADALIEAAKRRTNDYRLMVAERHNKQMAIAEDAKVQALRTAIDDNRRTRERAQENLETIFKARSERELIEEGARLALRSDSAFRKVNQRLLHEKDQTKRHALETEKRRIKEEAVRQAQVNFTKKSGIIGAISDKESAAMHRPVLDQLADARGSKFGPQILIGKGAAVASITLNTTAAIGGATEALLAIPPPVGEAMAAAVGEFLAMYGAEQVQNIINSSIDFPGRIGGLPLTYEDLLKAVWGHMGSQYEQIGHAIGQLMGFSGDVHKEVAGTISEVLGNLGPIGEYLGSVVTAVGDVTAAVSNAVGEVYKTAYVLIGSTIRKVTDAIASAVASVVNAIASTIGDVADAVFGWLFAEGGVVSHDSSARASVTPLNRSGLKFRTEVNVTIEGGLVCSAAEARRISRLIANEM